MKRAFAVAIILVLLISALFWIWPVVSAQQQVGPTLTISSGAGGSVIVQSSAINEGYPVTVASGQKKSWAVPYGASVTLRATDFDSGLTFRGWTGPLNGKPFNPTTITIGYSTSITSVFEAIGYPNALGVTLQTPKNTTYKQETIPATFTVANPNWAYFRLKVNDIRFYMDGMPWYKVATSRVKSSSANVYSYNSTLSALPEGEHSLYVVAGAQFEQIRELPLTMPGTPSPASGISEVVNFVVDTTPPVISVLSPQNKAYVMMDVPLSFVVNEAYSKIAYSLDRGVKVTIDENATLSELPAGVHNVTVYAWDKVSNIGASETITFTVAKPEPFPTSQLVAAAIVASVAIVSFGLLAYFVRFKRKVIT